MPDLDCGGDTFTSWEDLVRTCRNLGEGWIFRGQPTALEKPDLYTSLETAASEQGIPGAKRPEFEARLLREFQRFLHHYQVNPPERRDPLEWLALMRHHGAPTRLHDWTFSFYVAAFFALEDYGDYGRELWALGTDHFGKDKMDPDNRLPRDDAELVAIVMSISDPPAFVTSVNPFRLNERLTIQQGVFLFPGDMRQSFEDNLSAAQYRAGLRQNLLRFRLDFDFVERKRALLDLRRMNVTRVSLFPGLDGFAQSLKTRFDLFSDLTGKRG